MALRSQQMTAPHHRHAAVLRRRIVQVDEDGKQGRVGVRIKHQVLVPAERTRAFGYRLCCQLRVLQLDVLADERLDAGHDPGILRELKERGIGSGVHYPPIHLFKLYRDRGFGPGMFPHAERVGASTLTLPLFTQLRDADVDRVAAAVNDICERRAL